MSFHQKIVRNCRNPHKGIRYDTSGRALNSSHRSCFSPDIPKEYLTEQQQMLFNGTHPNPRKNQVSKLINKLEYYERFDDAEKVYEMYGYMYHEFHEGDPTPEEAIRILDALTPDDLK